MPAATPRGVASGLTPRAAKSISLEVKAARELKAAKAISIELPTKDEVTPRPSEKSRQKRKPMMVRSPSKSRIRSWVPRWTRGRSRSGSGSGRISDVPPAVVAQATGELVIEAMSSELADTVHSAAQAAADLASDMGMVEDSCISFYNAVVMAASRSLDPGASASSSPEGAGTGGAGGMSSASRIEAILMRAIKKSAVRVVDLFTEWDTDRSGAISKREFRSALKGTGIGEEDCT